jgi:hypothetical protein
MFVAGGSVAELERGLLSWLGLGCGLASLA